MENKHALSVAGDAEPQSPVDSSRKLEPQVDVHFSVNLIGKVYESLRQGAMHHAVLVEVWHYVNRAAETLLGTKFNELRWSFCHVYKRGWTRSYVNEISFSHPHRQLLVEIISANAPFANVLEIGCASGPNLYLLAMKFPNSRFVGVDINPDAVNQGKLFFEQHGMRNVMLFQGKADELEGFPDKSFDIVFTDAVLLYIGRDKIKKVAKEIQRIARRAIILVEHHSKQESDLGSRLEKWWLRNYIKLFGTFSDRINTIKIPPEIWGGNWGKLGYIIEVRMPRMITARFADEIPTYA
jgi:ubiquinone/menaquinone biosynthesis C-methylase UbiE